MKETTTNVLNDFFTRANWSKEDVSRFMKAMREQLEAVSDTPKIIYQCWERYEPSITEDVEFTTLQDALDYKAKKNAEGIDIDIEMCVAVGKMDEPKFEELNYSTLLCSEVLDDYSDSTPEERERFVRSCLDAAGL